ncbi:MAG: hypothetical protein IJS58_01735 [Bacilli bacterium]|nr:hypothetical protein [Bacilli bacterium]
MKKFFTFLLLMFLAITIVGCGDNKQEIVQEEIKESISEAAKESLTPGKLNGPTDGTISISEAVKLTSGAEAKVAGTIVATYAQGFMVYDGTDYILVYMGTSYEKNYAVGDYVSVSGALGSYKNRNQFTNTCTIEKLTAGSDYNLEETTLDLAALTTYVDAVEFGKKVKVTMKVTSKSASYINSLVGDSTEIGLCVTYPVDGDQFEVDKEYVVVGYSLYSSTYNNVKSLYVMLESVEPAVSEPVVIEDPKFRVQILGDELTLKDSFTVNKFGYSGVFDPDLSQYIWFVTKEQVLADESYFGFYERYGLFKLDDAYVVSEYIPGNGLKSIKDTNFDYVLMISPKSVNKAKFDAIKVGDVITLDNLPSHLEIGFVEVNAKVYSQTFTVKEYDKTSAPVQLEAVEKEGYEFLGWVKLNASEKEYVTEFSEDTVVFADYRCKTLYVDANDKLKYNSIAEAVAASQDGDTIILAPGVYTEEVLVEKGVTIKSELTEAVADAKDSYKDPSKAAIIKGKIYVSGKDITLSSLTFTETGKVGFYGPSTAVLNNFKFENNYVYNTNADAIAWKDNGSYGVGATTVNTLWSKYPGVVCLAGYYAWVTNAKIINNVFEDIAGTAVYDCVERGITVSGNIFNNVTNDAVRLDYGNAYGNFLFEENRFVNVGGTAIFLRSYGANEAAYITVRSNMFKNCGNGVTGASRSIPGAYASTAYQEGQNAIILFEYNVFEGNNGNISLRANVSNVTTWAAKNLTYTLDVKYNAFIMNSNGKVNKSFFASDSASTNWAVGTFDNNFYGVDFDEKFETTDDNFENILSKDTTTYENIAGLVAALPEGASLPEFDEIFILPLTDKAKDIINAEEPTMFVCAGVEEGKIYKVNGTRLTYGVSLFASLEDALAACTGGEKIFLFAGDYPAVTIAVDDITLLGAKDYAFKHNDTIVFDAEDTTLDQITANGINKLTIKYAVLSKQVLLTDVTNVVIENVVSKCNTDGTVKLDGTNDNITVKDYYYVGSAPRVVYVTAGTTSNVTVDHLVVMDSATVTFDANGKYVSGICDPIRFGQATAAKVMAGKVVVKNCYFRGGQSGVMDRFPDADEYEIKNNFFVGVPAAVYFRGATVTKAINYVVQYNTFIECGNSINDWDVVAVTTGDNTDAKVNYNAFINSFVYVGTKTDYVIKIRSAKGTINCADNYVNELNANIKHLNATGLTYLDDTYYVTDQEYELYTVVDLGGKAAVYGCTLFSEADYANLNRGSASAPLSIEEAARFIKGMDNKTFYDVNYGFVTGVVKSLSYNSKYDSYTAVITNNNVDLTVYSGNLDTGLTAFNVGDTIVAKGYFELYNSTLELAGDTTHDYPVYIAIDRPVYDVTLSTESSDKATVVLDQTTVQNGSVVSFVVNLTEGYKVKKVLVNDQVATFADGKYSAVAVGAAVIKVETEEDVDPNAPLVATAQYTGSTTSNLVPETNNAATIGLDAALFTVDCNKNATTNNPGINKDGTMRLYGKNGSVGCEISFVIAEGYTIKTVKLYVKSGTAYAVKTAEDVEGVEDVYTINGSSFTVYQTGANGTQVQINKIEIEYALDVVAEPVVVTAQYTGGTTTNFVPETNNAETIGLDASIFTVDCNKNSTTNNPGLNKDGTMRIYGKNGSIGGEISFVIAEGYTINTVKLYIKSGTAYAVKTTEDVEGVEGVYTINGSSFTVYQTGANATQVQINKIEIEYIGGAAAPANPVDPDPVNPDPVDPTPSGDVVVKATYTGSTTNMSDTENNAATLGLDATIFTVLGNKGASSNNPGLNKDGTIRLYGVSGQEGGQVSVQVAEGYTIKSVKFTFTQGTAYAVKTTENVEAVEGVYTINGNQFTIYQTGENTTQVRFNEMEITYAAN